jgi:ferredoxin--NADP+ reductase
MKPLKKNKFIPNKKYKPSNPFVAKVISTGILANEGKNDEIKGILIDINKSELGWVEGQSIGVIPPGVRESGKRHKVRLYSIASSRQGETKDPKTIFLCVKRVIYNHPDDGRLVKGLCSNYLCDLKENDELEITGPVGRTFFLPEDEKTNIFLFATGCGIAPYRAYLSRIFKEMGGWGGKVFLFYGVKWKTELLFDNEENQDMKKFQPYENFKFIPAISRERLKELGYKIYVGTRLAEQKENILPLLEEGNFAIYICGLKGMETGIIDVFKSWWDEKNESWDDAKKTWIDAGRWNEEVY